MKYRQPTLHELPTVGELVASTFKALIGALILLFTVILPAEYGFDPTKIGSLLGLTRMGEIKQQLAEEAMEAEEKDAVVSVTTPTPQPEEKMPETPINNTAQEEKTDTIVRTLAPDEAVEIKAKMQGGSKVTFNWVTEGGALNYDAHGEGSGSNFAQYDKGTALTGKEGEIVAQFDGSHGWYWRNRAGTDVTVTLNTKGKYSSVAEVN
jgi:hypothetical protein